MNQSKKHATVRSHEIRRRSTAKSGNSATSERAEKIADILADANIDKRSRQILAEAAADYAPLMKRLADK